MYKEKRSADSLVEKVYNNIKKEYFVIGKMRVRSWDAWLVLGLVAGIVATTLFIANRSGEFEQGMAAENVGTGGGPGVIYTSQKVSNAVRFGINGNQTTLYQTFTAPKFDTYLNSVSLALARSGNPSKNIKVSISEGFGINEYASTLILPKDLPTNYLKPKWIDVKFEKPAMLKAGKTYVLSLKYDDNPLYLGKKTNPNHYFWAINSKNPYSSGVFVNAAGKENRNWDALAGFYFTDATARSIKILTPNGGEKLNVGNTYRIKWDSKNIDKVSIGYSAGEGSLDWIAPNISNAGYYDWKIGVGNTIKTQFKIYIIGYETNKGSVSDYSDDYFTVSGNKYLNLISPNGGEIWQIDSSHTIKWEPYDPVAGVNHSNDVSAYLMRKESEKGELVTVGKVQPGGKASIHWVGEIDTWGKYPAPGDYYIRLVNNVTGEMDTSDNSFKLVSKDYLNADLKINGSNDPIFVPSEGKDVTVSWSSNADNCTIFNNTYSYEDRYNYQLDNLGSSGSRVIHLNTNTQTYDLPISLSCESHSNVEGSAHDSVYVLPQASEITVLAPNSKEEVLEFSKASMIVWSSYVDLKSVSIALYKNDASYKWIATNIPAAGIGKNGYSWTPSDTISASDAGLGQVWKIYIIGYKANGETVTDISDGPFNIIKSNDLVAHYTFDEGGEPGIIGSARSFNGTSDYVKIENSPSLTLNNQFTISFWFKPSATIDLNDPKSHVFIGKSLYDTIGTANSSGKIEIRGMEPRIYSNTNTWAAGKWYHSALTFNSASGYQLYVNGALEGSLNSTYSLLSTPKDINVGGQPDLGSWFAGSIDDLRIYSRALSATEINNLRNDGATTQTVSLRSPSSSLDGSIVKGTSNQTFGTFVLDVSGGPVVVNSIKFKLKTLPEINEGQITDFTSFGLYDGKGTIVGGPIDPVKNSSREGELSFRDQFIVPTGENIYTIKGRLSAGSSYANNTKINLLITPPHDLDVVSQNSGKTITASPSSVVTSETTTVTSGSLHVVLDANSPPYKIVGAGETNIELARVRFSAIGEDIDMRQFAFKLSKTELNSPVDLVNGEITLWDGSKKIGSAVFAWGDTAVSSLIASGDFRIPKESSKVLIIKGSISNISVSGPMLSSGDWLIVDYDGSNIGYSGNYGVGLVSGNMINGPSGLNGATGSMSSGARIMKAYPILADKNSGLSNTIYNGASQKLYRFGVTAKNGDIAISKLTFNITSSNSNVVLSNYALFAYTDSGFTSLDTDFSAYGLINAGECGAKNSTAGNLSIYPDKTGCLANATMYIIPSGTTRYFELRSSVGKVSGNTLKKDIVSVRLSGDAKYPDIGSAMGSASAIDSQMYNSFIWSPISTATQISLNDKDFTNGYAVSGLPSEGMNVFTLQSP